MSRAETPTETRPRRRKRVCPECGDLPFRVEGRCCRKCKLKYEPEKIEPVDPTKGLGVWSDL
jgi:rubredoxin